MSVDHSGIWHPPTTVHPSQLHAPPPPGCPFGDPIPAFTTQTPGELLDSFYSETRSDPDWTEPKCPLKKPVDICINRTAASRGLVNKWERPNGLAAEPVPVCVALDEPQFVVDFRNLNRGCPSTGFPLKDLYARRYKSSLEGADDIVFGGFGRVDLNLIIAWPGYGPLWFTISTVAKNGRPLTRFQLGRRITMPHLALFEGVEMAGVMPTQLGFYNIALHQGPRSKSGSMGVQPRQLHLVRLRGTVGGIWVADIDIV